MRGLLTRTAVARNLCVSWAFLFNMWTSRRRPPQNLETATKLIMLEATASENPSLSTCVIYATADEADAYMFYRCFCFCLFFFVFLFFFFRPPQNMRQTFSGTAERIFMKLLPNDTGENGVSNVAPKLVPPPGE